METAPESFQLGEETLRHQIRAMLNTHYTDVSEEAFNFKGKTDLFVRRLRSASRCRAFAGSSPRFPAFAEAFAEALPVACVGLVVNLVSALLLHEDEEHAHDNNLRAAYVHVLADAATSVLAIGAIVGVRVLRVAWLDPAMGLVGAGLIASWSLGLMRRASRVLLDITPDPSLVAEIR